MEDRKKAEHEATKELVRLGLDLIEKGAEGMSEESVDAWLTSVEEKPFPRL